MNKIWPTIVIVLFVLLAIAGLWFWRFQTYHLLSVKDRVLYRCGNRGMREYANGIRDVRPTVVISLLDDQELANPAEPQFAEEVKFLKESGIRFEQIKVKLGGWPSAENTQRFVQIMNDPSNYPVLIHCAQGVRRTGMFVAAFQRSVLKMNKAEALAKIETFGHSRRSIGDIEKFIDVYNPETCQMTQELAQSKE